MDVCSISLNTSRLSYCNNRLRLEHAKTINMLTTSDKKVSKAEKNATKKCNGKVMIWKKQKQVIISGRNEKAKTTV